jgi:predicted SnoaL-like aldol condensation-catalyzing enzyme
MHGLTRDWAEAPQIGVDIFRVEDGKLAEHWEVLLSKMPKLLAPPA